jgi:hypothetical protein
MPEPTSSPAEKLMVTLPSAPKEVSRDRASEAWRVTIKKVSKVEIGIKVKAFVITRVKKFVDIVTSPFFKKLLRLIIKNEQIKNETRIQKEISTIRTEDRRKRVRPG